MARRLLIAVMAALVCGAAFSEDKQIASSLKVNLYDVIDAGVVQPVNGITAAGQPDKAALEVFAGNGYSTVIDLRGEQEDRGLDEAAVVEALGMEYITFPITGLEAISFESAGKLDQLIASADGPVLVHCGSSNRVGALLALRKSLAGADDETSLAYGIEGGLTSLEGRVKEVLNED